MEETLTQNHRLQAGHCLLQFSYLMVERDYGFSAEILLRACYGAASALVVVDNFVLMSPWISLRVFKTSFFIVTT